MDEGLKKIIEQLNDLGQGVVLSVPLETIKGVDNWRKKWNNYKSYLLVRKGKVTHSKHIPQRVQLFWVENTTDKHTAKRRKKEDIKYLYNTAFVDICKEVEEEKKRKWYRSHMMRSGVKMVGEDTLTFEELEAFYEEYQRKKAEEKKQRQAEKEERRRAKEERAELQKAEKQRKREEQQRKKEEQRQKKEEERRKKKREYQKQRNAQRREEKLERLTLFDRIKAEVEKKIKQRRIKNEEIRNRTRASNERRERARVRARGQGSTDLRQKDYTSTEKRVLLSIPRLRINAIIKEHAVKNYIDLYNLNNNDYKVTKWGE